MKNILRPFILFAAAIVLLPKPAEGQLPYYVPSSGLLLYYSFNGNANDLSGNGANGTVSGPSYCADRFGTSNSAVSYNGVNERITTHKIDRTTTNSFTYSMWVNPASSASIPAQGSSGGLSSSTPYSCVIAPVDGWAWSTSGTDVGAGLNVATNGIFVVEHGPSITNCSLAWSGSLTGWHHVVVEYVSKLPKLYIDGAYIQDGVTSAYTVHPSLGCDSFSGGGTFPYVSTGFGHGMYPITVPTYNYAGALDDIAIYNRAISSCEITQLYDSGATSITLTGSTAICPGITTTLSASVSGGSWSSGNPGVATIDPSSGIATGVSSGTAVISYTVGTGCATLIVVTVSSMPSIAGATSMCQGATTTLTISTTGGTWSSSPEAVIGSTSGILTAVTAGVAHINYTLPSGCFSSTVVTINPLPPAPTGVTNACIGASSTLTDGMSGGTWSSSGSQATVGGTTGVVTGVTSGTVNITYTLPTTCYSFTPFTVNPSPAVITGTASVCIGATTTLSDATPGGTWVSLNPAIAAIGSGSGVVTGMAAGTTSISYLSTLGCTATKNVTVNPLPASISGSATVCAGGSTILTDGGGGTWTSSNTTISTVGFTTGSVSGLLPGADTIIYTLPTGCQTKMAMTVNPAPAVITGIAQMCVGVSTTMSDATPGGTWSSSNPSLASIGSSSGYLTGLVAGVVTIYYTAVTGCSSSMSFTVNPLPGIVVGAGAICTGHSVTLIDGGGGTWSSSNTLAAIIGSSSGILTALAPGTTVISYVLPTGCSTTIGETVNANPAPITGTLALCFGTTTTVSDITTGGLWSSGYTPIALIGSLSVIVGGVGVGPATISYTLSTGCYSTATVTVNPLPSVIAGGNQVCIGLNLPLSDAGGGTWLSSNMAVATVGSSSGIVAGVTTGTAIITYTLPTGCYITNPVTVNPLPAAITGSNHVCATNSITLSDVVPGGAWSSSDLATAYVDPLSGLVTGLGAGVSTIRYTVGTGCMASYNVTVNAQPAAITGVAVACVGATTTLFDAGGGTWSCSPATICSVNPTGDVTGLSAGSATVSYSYSTGCYASVIYTVNPVPAPITGTTSLCLGFTSLLNDATPGGAWTSGNTAVASIFAGTGFVTTYSVGTSTISYTLPTGCAVSTVVSVNSSPGPITGVMHVCEGSTTALSNGVGGGAWSIIPMTTATIGSTGVVTGVLPGTALVTYSLGGGCSVTGVVTVNSLPVSITGPSTVCAGSSILLSDLTPGGAWTSSSSPTAAVATGSGMVTGVSSGTAHISYTLSTGCYKQVIVTVNALPSPISGPGTLCPGGSVALTDISPGGAWSCSPVTTGTISTSGTLAGLIPGTITVSYTSGTTGCATIRIITVNPLPAPITGLSNVCVGSFITLTDVGSGTWGSASGNVSVGTASGTVTGLMSGTANVTYTLPTGCEITTLITVNPLPAPIGGPSAVCQTATITLTDTGSGNWASSVPTVAPIGSSSGILTGLITGTTTITYTLPTGCSITRPVTVTTAPGPIIGASFVCSGGTTTFTDAIPGGLWSSSSPAVATVGSTSGLVSGVTAGASATITYSLGAGCTVTKPVSVNAGPAAVSGSSAICIGTPTVYTDPTPGGTWACSPFAVATITGTGIVSGVTPGIASVAYTVGGCTSYKTVTVNTTPVVITGPVSVCSGLTIAEADAVSGGTWSTASGALSISGSSGVVTGMSAGTGIITYAIGTCRVTRPITVNDVPNITGPSGMCTGTTATFTASIPGGNWISSLVTVTTIGSSSGIAMAVSPGTSSIYYTLPTGCSGSASVTVNNTPTAISGPTHVCVGANITLANGSPGGTWTIAPATVADIDSSSGVVTGIAPGVATVTYSLGSGCTVATTITVNANPAMITGADHVCQGHTTVLMDSASGGSWSSSNAAIASIGGGTGILIGITAGTATIDYTTSAGCRVSRGFTVNPMPAGITGTATVCQSATITLSNATPGGTWISGLISVATIDSGSGLVAGMLPGTSTITYALSTGCAVTKAVTVNPSPAAITGGSVICVGAAFTLADATPGGSWSSDAPSVATVSGTGSVAGVGTGTATISYTLAGCPAMKTVSVNPFPGAITGPGHVCAAGAVITETNATPGGTWSSSNPVLGTVGSATGIVTGITAGTLTITYSLGPGCTVTTPFTVNPLPAGIAGPSHVCLGNTATLSDAAPGGTWSSANTSVAVIGTSGAVTGMSVGTALISYTVPSGCAATINMTVSIVPAISGLHNICAWGDTVSISDSIVTGLYTSSLATVSNLGGGLGRLTGNAPGLASVTYVLPTGCSTTATFTVNALPGLISGPLNICQGTTTTLFDGTGGGTWSSSNTTVATIDAGTGVANGLSGGSTMIFYTVTATGCKVDTLLNVTPLPVAGSILGSAALCEGNGIVLTDATPGGTWTSTATIASVTGGTVHAIAAGTDTIKYTVTNMCGTAVASTAVTINPLPLAGAITGQDTLCKGVPVTLGESIPGGVWSTTNTRATISTTGTLTGMTIGADTVIYSVSNAWCLAQAFYPVFISPSTNCLSLSTPHIAATGFTVWPNPSSGELNVTSSLSGTLTMFTVAGQRVTVVPIRSPQDIIFMPQSLANGVYVLEFTAETGEREVVRMVLER